MMSRRAIPWLKQYVLRQAQSYCRKRTSYPLTAFTDCFIGQSHSVKNHLAGGEVYFHIHLDSIHALKGWCIDTCDHYSSLLGRTDLKGKQDRYTYKKIEIIIDLAEIFLFIKTALCCICYLFFVANLSFYYV